MRFTGALSAAVAALLLAHGNEVSGAPARVNPEEVVGDHHKLDKRGCDSIVIDAFERPAGTSLGLNVFDKTWTDSGTMREPPKIVSTANGGALEFKPKGGESWMLTYMSCVNASSYEALRFKMTGPASVYGIGAITGGCKSAEESKQWYLPLQFVPTSATEPTEVVIPFSQLFPGTEVTSVNIQWLAWEGFPPNTSYQLHEVGLKGKVDGCLGGIPGQGAWLNAPPAQGKEDPGPVNTIPILPTGPRPYADLAPNYLWDTCPDSSFALTYDDGPWRYTNDLLDILKKNNIKVTFFVNGDNKGKIAEHVNVVRKAVADGHIIASHTWSHTSLSNLPEKAVFDEMQKLANAVHGIIGVYPTFMRPPFGAGWNDDKVRAILGKMGYHVIMYEIDANDYSIQQGTKTLEEGIQYYKDYFQYGNGAKKSGVISLTHDVLPTTVYNLTQALIDIVKANGYRFVQIDECVNKQDPKGWKPYSDTNALSNGTVYVPTA